jgi:hypothetical protein
LEVLLIHEIQKSGNHCSVNRLLTAVKWKKASVAKYFENNRGFTCESMANTPIPQTGLLNILRPTVNKLEQHGSLMCTIPPALKLQQFSSNEVNVSISTESAYDLAAVKEMV